MDNTATTLRQFAFEVVPAGWTPDAVGDTPFVPFVLDVPGIGDNAHARAASRAYWTAFSYLRIEPEDFDVFELLDGDARGRRVGPGGFVAASHDEPVRAEA